MIKKEKVQVVKDFAESIKGKALIYVDYKGLDVFSANKIRLKLRDNGGRFKVFKNTLIKRAFELNQTDFDGKVLKGMTGVTITSDDSFTVNGKVLYDAQKEGKLSIKGGFYQGEKVDGRYVVKIVSIPSEKILHEMLVASLKGVISQIVFTLEEVKKEKEKEKKL